MAFTGRLRELMKKYGKVALGVHLSVSFASITGFYVAIKNNVDVESVFERVGLSSGVSEKDRAADTSSSSSSSSFPLRRRGGTGRRSWRRPAVEP
ncbi:unnamed protein product [Musa textilis]